MGLAVLLILGAPVLLCLIITWEAGSRGVLRYGYW